VSTTYEDRWITCTPEEIEIRGYYVPWGSKRIPYASIRSLRQVAIGALRGRARIWGTANPRYWAHLDPRRPSKERALILNVGGRVQPFITPDDPDAVEQVIREHAHLGAPAERAEHSPYI